MACEPGEEKRVETLAAELDATIRALRGRLGEIGDRRIAVMAGLTVLDRLRSAETKIAELQERAERLERSRETAVLAADADAEPLIARLDALTRTVDALTATVREGARAASQERGQVDGAGIFGNRTTATFGRLPDAPADASPAAGTAARASPVDPSPDASGKPHVASSPPSGPDGDADGDGLDGIVPTLAGRL